MYKQGDYPPKNDQDRHCWNSKFSVNGQEENHGVMMSCMRGTHSWFLLILIAIDLLDPATATPQPQAPIPTPPPPHQPDPIYPLHVSYYESISFSFPVKKFPNLILNVRLSPPAPTVFQFTLLKKCKATFKTRTILLGHLFERVLPV